MSFHAMVYMTFLVEMPVVERFMEALLRRLTNSATEIRFDSVEQAAALRCCNVDNLDSHE